MTPTAHLAQKSASPRDGLITPSHPESCYSRCSFSVLLEKPTGGGNRHLEVNDDDDRMTVVPDFLGELDAGVFMNKNRGSAEYLSD